MKWLITGCKGQLGLTLQIELASRNIEFIAVDSTELDITKSQKVDQLVEKLKPNVIVNTAAWTDVDSAESNKDKAYEVNAIVINNLAYAASKFGICLVQISTDYVFSGENSDPWTENAVHKPQTIYGYTKSQGEKLLISTLPTNFYIIRTAWLYSAKRKNFAKMITAKALNESGEVRVVNDQIGQPTFAGDLARQIVDLVLTEAPSGVYHGTNSGEATWFEFAQEIFKLASADILRVVPISTNELQRPAKRPAYSVLGHDTWADTKVPVMRDWRLALAEAMPAIITAIKAEE
jgi:dTDP-4-dehydrorhamnose reductase